MKSLTKGYVKSGIDSVKGPKWRNFWTMLGIIIGVASVITVVGIGDGIKQQISTQINSMKKGVITIRPSGLHVGGTSSGSIDVLTGLSVTGSLAPSDAATVASTPGIVASAPLTAFTDKVGSSQRSLSNNLIIGTSENLASLLNQSMEFGVFISNNPVGNDPPVVLGSNVAGKLFSEEAPLGQTVMIDAQPFMVSGIFNAFSDTPFSDQADYNNAVFIPENNALSLTHNTASTYALLALPNTISPASQAAAIAKLTSRLEAAHAGQHNFSVSSQSSAATSNNGVLNLLAHLITGVAAISLLVGGIGIMNVMMVSVTERMHEIGIRKALGATNRQILSQFMIESTMLSVSGGVIGIVLAFLVDLTLHLTTNLAPDINWEIVAFSAAVSLIVGIVFGSYPALKAARKDPIEALRLQ